MAIAGIVLGWVGVGVLLLMLLLVSSGRSRWSDPHEHSAATPDRELAAFPAGVYVQQQRTNGFAVASLALGILWIFWIGSILALVFGLIAKRQIDESGGGQSGLGSPSRASCSVASESARCGSPSSSAM